MGLAIGKFLILGVDVLYWCCMARSLFVSFAFGTHLGFYWLSCVDCTRYPLHSMWVVIVFPDRLIADWQTYRSSSHLSFNGAFSVCVLFQLIHEIYSYFMRKIHAREYQSCYLVWPWVLTDIISSLPTEAKVVRHHVHCEFSIYIQVIKYANCLLRISVGTFRSRTFCFRNG